MTFTEKLDSIIEKHNSLLCIGLDSDIDKLPSQFHKVDHPQFAFNKWIIDQTPELVCAYKPNTAFYEARGAAGIEELKMTCEYLRSEHPDIAIILDAKRGDIGNTNTGYLQFAYDYLGADAITLHPYLGKEALQPFLDRKDKGCIILCRTSNPGASELQDVLVDPPSEGVFDSEDLAQTRGGARRAGDVNQSLYTYIAQKAATEWNTNNNVLLVVGATYPEELKQVRSIVGDMTLLVPGIGAQGGDVEKTVKAGMNSAKKGIIINSSRSIIFAPDPRSEAEPLRDAINRYRA